MARDFFINGECLVSIRGAAGTAIAAATELGLADSPITVTPNFKHQDIAVDTFGGAKGPPPEIQYFLSDVTVSMNLVHFDRTVLDEVWRLSMGGATTIGTLPRAGSRMGGNVARYAAGWNFVSLRLTSQVGNKPWHFRSAYIVAGGGGGGFPLGTERSVVPIQWRVVPYVQDPWGAGAGSSGVVLWDYTAGD